MRRTLIGLAALAVVAAACGGGDTGATGEDGATTSAAETTTTAADTTTTEAETTTTGEPATESTVLTTADTDLGTILVDGEGRTLYIFTPDEAGQPTCTGGCATSWPPLLAGVEPGDGIDPELIGTATHPEEGEMVTYNGWPLYYYAGDSAPGDTNGQGVNEVWFVIGPDGEPITEAAASSSPSRDYDY